MNCRPGCGACCIAPSISSAIPNMPNGKKSGERCLNLDGNNFCKIYNTKDYPKVCSDLKASKEMCGQDSKEAIAYILNLEELTS